MNKGVATKLAEKRVVWSREELIIVLDLYFCLPRRKFTESEPQVSETARLIGRSPAAVAMRLANYIALDDRAGAGGLSHSGDHAKRVWEEFQDHPAELSIAASESRAKLLRQSQSQEPSQNAD